MYSTITLPTFLGDYILENPLGSGGMKIVVKAHHVLSNSTVAMALLPNQGATDEVHLRFRREIEILRRIDHPNIVPILDDGSRDGFDYFVMPYLDGETLGDRMLQTTIPWPMALNCLKTVAAAIAQAHQLGFIHRDIKPDNIMLCADGSIKIIDFGLARAMEEIEGLTRIGQGLGTRFYVAPEQMEGLADQASTAGDIYSLGATLLEMLIGRSAFHRLLTTHKTLSSTTIDFAQWARQHPDIPPSLFDLCRNCLHRIPDQRFASSSQLIEAIESIPNEVTDESLADWIRRYRTNDDAPSSPSSSPRPERMPERGPQAGLVIANRFHLLSLLGRGGMGEVWKATVRNRPNPVAIKFLPPEFQTPERLEELRQRFSRVEKLSHSNICSVTDLDVDPRVGPFLVMRYLHGLTLAQWIQRRASMGSVFTPEETHRLLLPIAQALDYAHGRGIVHRDVKPENILITDDDSIPFLVDFELSSEIRETMTRLTHQVHAVGTIAYLSPEAWRGKGKTPSSDQYALGLIAYEMLAGELPFGRNCHPEAARQCTLNEPIPAIAELGEVNEVLCRGLAKQPSDRFESCQSLIEGIISAPASANRPALHPPVAPDFPRSAIGKSNHTHSLEDSNRKDGPFVKGHRPLVIAGLTLMALALSLTIWAATIGPWRSTTPKGRIELAAGDDQNRSPASPVKSNGDSKPLNPRVDDQFWKACSELQSGRYSLAIESFSRVIEIEPEHATAFAFRGLAKRHLSEFPDAIRDFDRAIEIEPQFVDALIDRAETYRLVGKQCQQKSPTEALEWYSASASAFTQVLKLEPKTADALRGRGSAKYSMQLYADSIDDLTSAIQLNGSDADAYECRGLSYWEQQEFRSARDDFEKALQLDASREHLKQKIEECSRHSSS